MVNNFYGSTQSRLKTYTADRRVEERNGDIQQAKVYKKLAEDRGDVETADRLSKLATMVINKFGQQVQAHTVDTNAPLSQQPFDVRSYIKTAIQNGTLSQLWDKIKAIPKSSLSKTAHIIQHDIKHSKDLKEAINEELYKYSTRSMYHGPKMSRDITSEELQQVKLKPESIVRPIVDDVISNMLKLIGGDNDDAISELVQKANADVASTVGQQANTKKSAKSSVRSDEMTEAETLAEQEQTFKLSKNDVVKKLTSIIVHGFEENKAPFRSNYTSTLERYSKRPDFQSIIDENEMIRKWILNFKPLVGSTGPPSIINRLQMSYKDRHKSKSSQSTTTTSGVETLST